jgi:hypothetical protein
MPRPLLLAVLAVLLVALTPATSRALIIKSATIMVHPVKGDAFAIKGELDARDPPGIDLAAATRIVFDLDGVVAGFGGADFKRTKTRLSFKGPSRSPGVSQLVIDLKKRRFAAKGTGLLLPPLPATFTVRLRADDAIACALLPFERLGKLPAKPPTKPKAVKYGLPKKHPGSPCLLAGRLRATPPVVIVDTPTTVRFEATLAAGIVPDAGGVQVRRVEAGVAVDPPLCTLVDDGGSASGDLVAGDGLHACAATVDAAAASVQQFVAQATVGATSIGSALLRVPVVPEPTEADVTAVLANSAAARQIWDGLQASLGNSLNARLATIRAIAALPGVAEARLGANGLDITIRYTSGFRGGLMLSARFDDTTALQPVVASRRSDGSSGTLVGSTSTLAGSHGTLTASPGTPAHSPRAPAPCPVTPDRTLIGNRKAIVLTTSYFGADDDWPKAKAGFDGSCLPITTTPKTLTLSSVLDVASASALFFSTHGFMDDDGTVEIVTDQTVTAAEASELSFRDPTKRYETFMLGLPADITGGGRDVWAFVPEYLLRIPGQFDKAFVYASQCHGAEHPAEAAVFRKKGARTFFGYIGSTSTNFANLVTDSLIPDLAQHLLTTGEAYDRTVKIDPTPVKRLAPKGIRRVDLPPATFEILGATDLAYTGKPTIAPATSTLGNGESVVLTPSVESKGDCDLRHSWTSTVKAGELSDDMGTKGGAFETLAATVTYQADDEGGGTDDMTVAVRTESDAPFFGLACASVEVRGCGDGIVNGNEECDVGVDGTADGACPGKCLPDCTCRKDPRCGNGIKEPGEICDGADREICDAVATHGVGHCHADCHGCAQCGDGVVDPNEECDPGDDSPCPGGCRGDCVCGCAPGDPTGCGPTECCHPTFKTCCTPRRNDPDPACFATASGCCGNAGTLPPDFCSGPGGPSVCPDAECNDTSFYWCHTCDGKFMEGFCTFTSCD